MSVVEELRRRVEDAPNEVECGICAARYDSQRLNCPACGSGDFRDA
ncbi:hypothetical protein [Halobacterium sp. CBA1126]|nr:hypothetical protein [Halobacterium sp. CBA1126]MUV60449.1 hypothetical protein [Halobacterium sp. CBA1126]